MRRPPSPLAVCCSLVLALAGCGEKEEALGAGEPQELDADARLLPERRPRRHLRGARRTGYFKQVGLDVKIRQPADPAAPIKQVAADRVDLAISYEPEVLRARDQGLQRRRRRRARAASR